MNELQIPSGWHKQTLGRIASIRIGKTPPRDHDEFWDVHKQSQNVWLSIRDMTSRYLFDSAEYITDKAIREFNIPAVEMGTILLSFKLTIGKVAIAQRELRTNEAIAAIKILDRDQTDNDFLSYGLSHWNLLQNVDQAIKGATLNKKKLREIEFTLPIDPAEQRAIADILSTVDEAIAQSESLVRKYQSIKQGLMSDLLTRGVDGNGDLRPTQEEAPKLYKETKLGYLPKEWDEDYLVKRLDFPTGQIDPRRQPYRNQILIAPDHIEQKTGRIIKLSTAEEQKAISGKYPFEKGDVLYSKIRPYLRKAALAEFNGICSADVYPLKPRSNLSSKYLLAILLSEPFSVFATAFSFRSGFPKINRKEMAEFVTGFPKPEEQERICNILKAFEKTVETEELGLRKLQALRQGLMQDLLSGQVRVRV